jgi:hypothetical protein
MSGRRRVVLSATLDPVYSFFAPLTALVWRRVAAFEPLLLLVGHEDEWRSHASAQRVLAEAVRYAEVVFVPRVSGASDHTLAQVARLCAGALDGVAEDDYLLVSDVDLWPLSVQLDRAADPSYAFHIFNADAYLPNEDRFPMCHLGGRRAVWREVFSLDDGLPAALARIPWPADGDWHFDERYATARLRAWPRFHQCCQLLARPARPGHGRLDRADWRFDGALDSLTDAHLLRPGFSDENWPRVHALLRALLGDDDFGAATAYRTRYVEPARASVHASTDVDLDRWFRLWFREVARLAPEPFRSYGGYGDGEPNGTACSVEAIRAFAGLVDDPDAVVLNAGAGASSFLLRRLFRHVVCVDSDPTYLEVVRRICIANGLSGDGFIVGLENAPEADFTFYGYGEITVEGRLGHYGMAYRKTRRALYYDDADDRPHGFPHYRRLLLDFAAAQGIAAQDCHAARDGYGRWGVILRKAPPVPERGLIAFSLWGDDPLYLRGAVANLPAAAAYYPGFRVRIYTDDPAALDGAARAVARDPACDAQTFAARAGVTLEVVAMPRNVGIHGMFWRFLAACDQQSDPILFRDCDSRLNPREAEAVAAWLASGRKFHVMHDHPDHADWPMLGGMWGVRGGVMTDMERRIAAWGRWDAKPDDMVFLTHEVWPEAGRDVLHHASVPARTAPAAPFPPHPPWRGFVGEIVRGD